jgi:hypothetical protein
MPDRRGSQGRSTDYRFHGTGYKLNYCPECGKKMDALHRTMKGEHDETESRAEADGRL